MFHSFIIVMIVVVSKIDISTPTGAAVGAAGGGGTSGPSSRCPHARSHLRKQRGRTAAAAAPAGGACICRIHRYLPAAASSHRAGRGDEQRHGGGHAAQVERAAGQDARGSCAHTDVAAAAAAYAPAVAPPGPRS